MDCKFRRTRVIARILVEKYQKFGRVIRKFTDINVTGNIDISFSDLQNDVLTYIRRSFMFYLTFVGSLSKVAVHPFDSVTLSVTSSSIILTMCSLCASADRVLYFERILSSQCYICTYIHIKPFNQTNCLYIYVEWVE